MARRRNVGAAAGSKSGVKFPPPSGPWGALQALMDDGGQVTLGAVGPIQSAAVASMPKGMLAGLVRREGEKWDDLLLRLNEAVMQSVVENRVINELHTCVAEY
jgi:hypothetical protein